MKKTKQVKTAASLTLHNVPDMTYKGRMAVCKWLYNQYKMLKFDSNTVARTYTARYRYEVTK